MSPSVGWVTPVDEIFIVDGDTVDCVISKRVRVRLLGINAPESRTRDREERSRGLAARTFLGKLIHEDTRGEEKLLEIPGNPELAEIMTFGRVLGNLWIPGRDINVADHMIESGYGKPYEGR